VRVKSAVGLATIVVFCGIIVLFVAYVGSLGIRVAPPSKRSTLALEVPDINNIAVDSNVLLRGVPVGKVTRVDTSLASATIHFYVDGRYRIPADTEIRLENLSTLGESYIELEPRTSDGPSFRDGQAVPQRSVKQPPSISELAVSVVRVLNQLDPGQLGRVVGEADVGLPDPVSTLPNLARASLLLRNTVAEFKGQGRDMLANVQVLLENAGFVGPALAGASPGLRDLGPITTVTWNDAWTIGQVLIPEDVMEFSLFLQRLQKFLDDRGRDLRILGESTSENVKLIAAALRNFDSSQILSNLLATVPEDGTVNLHVTLPHG